MAAQIEPDFSQMAGLGGSWVLAAEVARLKAELETQRERDAAAKRERDEFLSFAAHELRTPLTLILGYSQSIARRLVGRADAERETRDLELIVGAARRLNGMVDALLDVSRIETDRLVVSRQQLGLDRVVRKIVAQVSQGRMIDVHTEPDLPAVLGDPARVEQVLRLLVTNALQVTPEDLVVEVVLRLVDQAVEVSVLDGGPVIPTDALSTVFETSRIYPEVAVDKRSGLGVGLYVARGIVRSLGGEIRVEPGGKGNRFTVSLPNVSERDLAPRATGPT